MAEWKFDDVVRRRLNVAVITADETVRKYECGDCDGVVDSRPRSRVSIDDKLTLKAAFSIINL
jgi:hypothetical protein